MALPPPPKGVTLTTTAEAGVSHGIKCLVYGEAGVGKTRLCATAPAPVIISAEAGLLSVRGYDIPVLPINELDDLNRAFDYLTRKDVMPHYHTICVDSITEIAEKVLTNAKKGSKDGRMAYGILAEQMWQTIRSLRDVEGKCVIMTAKAEYVKDDKGATRWMPSMPGKTLTQGLAYYFDEVFYYGSFRGSAGEFKALQTRSDLQYVAKDRSGALEMYENPDLKQIFEKIYYA